MIGRDVVKLIIAFWPSGHTFAMLGTRAAGYGVLPNSSRMYWMTFSTGPNLWRSRL